MSWDPESGFVVNEGSAAAFACTFADEDGLPATPLAITWSLTDEHGVVINSRDHVVVAAMSNPSTIVIDAADTQLSGPDDTGLRLLTVMWTYTSAHAAGLHGTAEFWFSIAPLVAVP
jgi:hypothetical protein